MNGTDQARGWLVTGASGGLGQAICRAALDVGDRVVATARESIHRDILGADDDRVVLRRLDVTDAVAARGVVDEAVGTFGRVDPVVNNAGYEHFGAVEELSDHDIRQQFEVNFFGLVNVTRAALPHLRRQGSGHLVQMSSLTASSAWPGVGLLRQQVRRGGTVRVIGSGGGSPWYPRDAGGTGTASHRIRRQRRGARKADVRVSSHRRRCPAGLCPDGWEPTGDPRRAATAIVEAVSAAEPPLRLVLGSVVARSIRRGRVH